MVFCATLFFLYLAMATLKTQQYWRDQVRKLEVQVALRQQINDVLKDGGKLDIEGLIENVTLPGNEMLVNTASLPTGVEIKKLADGAIAASGSEIKGVRQLKAEVRYNELNRGRFWFECLPEGQPDASGQISISFTVKPEDVMIVGSIVQVFEEAPFVHEDAGGDPDQCGQYLGEFEVMSVTAENATLKFALDPAFYPEMVARLQQSVVLAQQDPANTWIIYELMPNDSHSLFASLDEDTLQTLFGDDKKDEYYRDLKPAEATDPEERVDADGNYNRLLNDYTATFRLLDTQLVFLDDEIAKRTADLDAINASLAKAKASEQVMKNREALLTQRKDTRVREKEVAAAHRKNLEEAIAKLDAQIEQFVVLNKSKARKLTEIHSNTINRANQRTATVNAQQ